MSYVKRELPSFPCVCDLWDRLASEKRPVVVYGMGNGADKLIERFKKYNIKISDFFASDGFVRGHEFHGMRVKSFSEIKETYSDFVIVLSFASNREDVLSMLNEIDKNYEMFVPDMPVAGVDEYFDREFFNTYFEEIERAYNSFDDEESKNAFASIIHFKLTGKMQFLEECYSTKNELYSQFPTKNIGRIIDCGAYNGDTFREAKLYFENLSDAILIEPDKKNYKRLMKFLDKRQEDNINVTPINSAVWSAVCGGEFSASGNRNSSINSTSSFEHREDEVSMITVDSLNTPCDYIKYDVEGAELEALIGSHKTISEFKPNLLISVYHRSRDIFSLVNYMKEKYPFYNFKLRRLRCLPAWEIDLILTT